MLENNNFPVLVIIARDDLDAAGNIRKIFNCSAHPNNLKLDDIAMVGKIHPGQLQQKPPPAIAEGSFSPSF